MAGITAGRPATSLVPGIKATLPTTLQGALPAANGQFGKLRDSINNLNVFAPITATQAPPGDPSDGMIRLAKSPWRPVSGQTQDAWVYYNAHAGAWEYLTGFSPAQTTVLNAVGPATVAPLPDAPVAVVGTSPLYARQDHVHPMVLMSAPGGRLTLSATEARPLNYGAEAVTTVYYLPHFHNYVPIYNGTAFSWSALPPGGLSNAYSDTTKNPAAVPTTSCSVFDLYIWSDSGTLRLCRSPAWGGGSGGTRTAPVVVSGQPAGLYTNASAITNGPAAGRGTWVGTVGTYVAGSSYNRQAQSFTTSPSGDSLGHVWNTYNRLPNFLANNGAAGSTFSATANASGSFASAMRQWFVLGDITPVSFSGNLSTPVGLATFDQGGAAFTGSATAANIAASLTNHVAVQYTATAAEFSSLSGRFSLMAGTYISAASGPTASGAYTLTSTQSFPSVSYDA